MRIPNHCRYPLQLYSSRNATIYLLLYSLPVRRLSASIQPTSPDPTPPEPTPLQLNLPEFTLFELTLPEYTLPEPTPPVKASDTPSFEITDLAALPPWAAFDGAFMDSPLLPPRHLCPLEILEPDAQKDPKRMKLPEQKNPCRSVDMPNGMFCKGWSFSRPSSGIGKYRWTCTLEAHIPKSAFRGQKSHRFSIQARLEFGSLDCPLSADEVIVLVTESNKSSFIELASP